MKISRGPTEFFRRTASGAILHAMEETPHGDFATKALLVRWRDGDPQAGEELAALVYANLRRLASAYMRKERPDHTLSPTGLVHEAYLRLLGGDLCLQDRAHFIAMAATEMRRVLVDHARARSRDKRGGEMLQRVTLDDFHRISNSDSLDMLAVQEALDRLKQVDERKAQLVDLICFGGLSIEESAAILNLSTATIGREWRMARAWLQRELKSAGTAASQA